MSSSENLPLKSKLAYGVGDFAGVLVFTTVSTFLMFFYTDVVGLPAAAVGGLLFAARTVDAVWDIFLGVTVDRTRSRWGQCRPYLLFGAPLLALLAVAVFTAVDGSAAFKLAYAYVTYIGLMMAYSLVTIPYGAMPALMTDQMRDRNRMIMIRTVFSYASALLINTQTLKLVAWLGGGNKQIGYQHTVLLMAVASIVLYWLCFAGTRERVTPLVQPMHVRRDLGTLARPRTSVPRSRLADDDGDVYVDFDGLYHRRWLDAVLLHLRGARHVRHGAVFPDVRPGHDHRHPVFGPVDAALLQTPGAAVDQPGRRAAV